MPKTHASIPIVFSSDDNYAPYLGVCIHSAIAHMSPSFQYIIYILDGGISPRHKAMISSLTEKHIQIKFIAISEYLKKYNISQFPLTLHFTAATYYRFFLPDIFPQFNKLIYLDCDMLVLRDLAELFDIDVKNYYLAASRDIEIIRACYALSPSHKDYYYQTLKMQDHTHYIQAGCLVCNLAEMRKHNLTQTLLAKLQEIGKPKFVDQCVLNAVCEGHVLFISNRWNYTWHLGFWDKNYKSNIPEPFLSMYLDAQEHPYIIHFTGQGLKPWLKPGYSYSHLFWQYARQTPFYEEILYQNISALSLHNTNSKQLLQQIVNRHKILRQYYRCKILSKITWGNKRRHYKQKRNKLHEQVRQIRNCLKH